jgi:hypothetical protein
MIPAWTSEVLVGVEAVEIPLPTPHEVWMAEGGPPNPAPQESGIEAETDIFSGGEVIGGFGASNGGVAPQLGIRLLSSHDFVLVDGYRMTASMLTHCSLPGPDTSVACDMPVAGFASDVTAPVGAWAPDADPIIVPVADDDSDVVGGWHD